MYVLLMNECVCRNAFLCICICCWCRFSCLFGVEGLVRQFAFAFYCHPHDYVSEINKQNQIGSFKQPVGDSKFMLPKSLCAMYGGVLINYYHIRSHSLQHSRAPLITKENTFHPINLVRRADRTAEYHFGMHLKFPEPVSSVFGHISQNTFFSFTMHLKFTL